MITKGTTRNGKSKKIFSTLLATGIFSAVIASGATLIVSYHSSITLNNIEKFKLSGQIATYRLTKLVDTYENIITIKEAPTLETYINTQESPESFISAAKLYINSIDDITSMYKKIRPLIDSDLRNELDEIEEISFKNLFDNSRLLKNSADQYDNFDQIPQSEFNNFIDALRMLENFTRSLIDALDKQITRIVNANNK